MYVFRHVNLQLTKSPQEDGEEYVSLSLMHETDCSSSTPSVVKAIYRLIIYDQLYMMDMQNEGNYIQNSMVTIAD